MSEKVKPKYGDRQTNQLWSAWNLLNEFAKEIQNEDLFQELGRIADRIERELGADE